MDGQLHYYDYDEQFNLIATHQRGTPGSFLPNEPVLFPELDQLKRVYISTHNNTPSKAISFMLPYNCKPSKMPYAGAIVGSYTSILAPTLNLNQPTGHKERYKIISKTWRASFSTLHPDTNRFLIESQLDSNQGEELSKITTAIKKLQVIPTMKVMLHKIINWRESFSFLSGEYLRKQRRRGEPANSPVLVTM